MMIPLLLSMLSYTAFLNVDDKLNQLDLNGKKHGKWVVYRDARWKNTDSSHAVHTWYTWYDHGSNLYPMGGRGKKWKMVSSSVPAGTKILDGEYRWYDEKGRLRSVDVFKNGAYISCEWYLTSGQREQLFDYTRHLEGQEHSWYMAEYNKKGELKFEGYFGKAQYGWKIYDIKTQNDVSPR